MGSHSSELRPHVAFVGAGALGAFVGGTMSRAGHAVTLIDPWPRHVEVMRSEGLRVSDATGEYCINVNALGVGEVSALRDKPVDIAFICTKLYDTQWCTALIAPYLSVGCIVTMQNAFAEHEVAAVVGRERVVGCVASRVQVELRGPGCVQRTNAPGGAAYTAFRVGEMHGRATPRARGIVDLLSHVDSAKVTTNLWGERWSKLVANAMTSAVCAISGLSFRDMYEDASTCRLVLQLATEAIAVGVRLGFALEPIFGLEPALLASAATGDAALFAQFQETMLRAQSQGTAAGRSGIAQDLAKGRRTEVEHINGYVVARAAEVCLAAPTHQRVIRLVHAIEQGLAVPGARLTLEASRDFPA